MTDLFSHDAEQSIISGLMLDGRLFELCDGELTPEDFYISQCRTVYAHALLLIQTGKPADVVSIFQTLPKDSQISLADLNAMAQYSPSWTAFKNHVAIVKNLALSRRLAKTGIEICDLASQTGLEFVERLTKAGDMINALEPQNDADEWLPAYAGMIQHQQLLDDRSEGKVAAWPTGLHDFDEILDGGLWPGSLYIIGARPSMGKTALGMSIGLKMAETRHVAFFSMEMSHADLFDRCTAMLGDVSMSEVKRPSKKKLNWTNVVNGVEKSRDLLWHATDRTGLTIGKLRVMTKRLKRRVDLKVIVVDYLGLMVGSDSKMPRAYQIEEITQGLKALAKELDIAVICLVQVNRKVEERANSAPMMSDLKDSGAIEQDADVIAFIHRPIHQKPELGKDWEQYAELTIPKNRQGASGKMIPLRYFGDRTIFRSWIGEFPSKPTSKGSKNAL